MLSQRFLVKTSVFTRNGTTVGKGLSFRPLRGYKQWFYWFYCFY